MKKRIWYRVVGFGPTRANGMCASADAGQDRIAAVKDGGYTQANSRVYGYESRAAARKGDISDDIGQNGRVE